MLFSDAARATRHEVIVKLPLKRVVSVVPSVSASVALAVACSSSSPTNSTEKYVDAGYVDLGGDGSPNATSDGAPPFIDDASDTDVTQNAVDGGYLIPDAGVVPADRFITQLVSVSYGTCAGYGQALLPGVIEGPPIGAGASAGSTDVLSLGGGGTIVVSFGANAIVDGPGPDFIVFENAFDTGTSVYAEPGEVSVSDDGVTWQTYPCTATMGDPPYGSCAGWHPVFSNPDNGISPFDVAHAGGDAFDLKDLGVTHAKFVRIVDKTNEDCPDAGHVIANGFDLDAIAIVNAQNP
jgi:hypothetical protein